MDRQTGLIRKLQNQRCLTAGEWEELIGGCTAEDAAAAQRLARKTARENFGNSIYIRGLIEFTNYCRNDCYYCGLRCSNRSAKRYRLSEDEILSCCEDGYASGFRTFVLQGGEDGGFSDAKLCRTVERIKSRFEDCAVTLSVGERDFQTYRAFRDAGADRYLLRHETADEEHYRVLHPPSLSLEHRKECLWMLKELGFQMGAGFMVGSPGQTAKTLAKDLVFLQELQPHMVGIGPFLPQKETPFGNCPGGSTDLTVFLLACVRLVLPQVLMPATTALSTASADGRRRGVLAGANVVMPNLSPPDARKNYILYDGKATAAGETAQELTSLKKQMDGIGYRVVCDRGDSPMLPSAERIIEDEL